MDTVIPPTFPLIEGYRAELRANRYTRLSEAEGARVAERFARSHHSNAMEDIHPSPALAALFAMFVEERVPVPLAEQYADRYLAEAFGGTAAVDARRA